MQKTHISSYELALHICGQAEPETAAAVADHLATGCPECSRAHQVWKAFSDFAQSDRNFEPPAETLEAAFRIFPTATERPDHVKKALASLVFDSFAVPASAGLRSSRRATYRQLVYSAQRYCVDLNVERLPDEKLNITGQVLREDPPGPPGTSFLVQLFEQGKPIATTVANRLGEFSFEKAPQRASTMTLALDDREVEVLVGAPPAQKEEAT